MIDFFLGLNPLVQAAIISAIVALATMILGTPLRYIIDKRALRHKLSTEYEYEQRKQLRVLIGRYYGRLIEASERLNFRLWNLYANESKGWLNVHSNYSKPESNYYYTSTVYRYLSVIALVRKFETEAIFIDPRIADSKDLRFLKYLKALYWVCTDTALFKDLHYDNSYAKDHFFSDALRQVCDSCWIDNRFMSIEEFQNNLKKKNSFKPVLEYFDGLCMEESRFRWDRLVAFHLILMAFINSIGYDMQKTSKEQLSEVANRIRNKEIAFNLAVWFTKLSLGKDKETKKIFRIIKKMPALANHFKKSPRYVWRRLSSVRQCAKKNKLYE
jgi:hypothetical protein